MLLIHSATLEIRSVLGWLRFECYYKNSICVGQVRELLPILTSHALSYITRGQIYSTYIRTVLLYASEVGPPMSTTCVNCNVMIEQ